MVKTISRQTFFRYLATIGLAPELVSSPPGATSAGVEGIEEHTRQEEPPRPYCKSDEARAHIRNTATMLASLRCGAKTRSGAPCRSPAVNGKLRCRMHGGALRSGGQLGNLNALKGDPETHRTKTTRLMIRRFLRGSKYKRLRRR